MLDERDTWFHHMIGGGHIESSNGVRRVKVAYLKGRIKDRKQISGRLLSLAANIEIFASEKAKSINEQGIHFRGCFYAAVKELRAADLEVTHDPTPNDCAHSLIRFKDTHLADEDGRYTVSIRILRQLQSCLEFVDSSCISYLEEKCGRPLSLE